MKALVLQHHPDEHPGAFRALMTASGVTWDAVELDAGEKIPALDGYDLMLSMGGPMDVWETDKHPWLKDEKEAIREWVGRREKPFLGVCLGHQLLADALGGACEKMPKAEIGVLGYYQTFAGTHDRFFDGVGSPGQCLQWHGVQVTDPPSGAQVLASSEACAIQAMRFGRWAYSMQFHAEITEETVPRWGVIPEYKCALENVLGADALEGFVRDAAAAVPDMNRDARLMWENFHALISEKEQY